MPLLIFSFHFVFPEYQLTVLAAEFSPHTTSDGAAGYWEPIFMDQTPEDKVEKWAIETYL